MSKVVFKTFPLGFQWPTPDPFLFCVHHEDAYPKGNDALGPAASLDGRDMGQDFAGKDGWRMYHGHEVPGFPQHPHRGFETVTIVRKGLIDHSDSLGATARFGNGDVQWLTAGAGIVHAEMFPLLQKDAENPAELFQIWLNLPAKGKMVPPHFSMFWRENIPSRQFTDGEGRTTNVTIIAGALDGTKAPPPPPHSWASYAESELAMWTIEMAPRATYTLPAAVPGLNRTLYFFRGARMRVDDMQISRNTGVQVRSDAELTLEAGDEPCELLVLQGRPIGEPVAQYGPFVMNTREEIQQAFADYQRTQFGGWPWQADGPVHTRDEGRFAKHADGRIEKIE